ncbi:arylsulfatase [Niastella koreensis]|uniref:Sulfatase n=2 Tax=Niastella koreensis TaxID=354356 RepID=G8T8H4_NIAKG|nr:arylsulfatase [Niastella koreensis]AEW00146.1 sulfatase [Niastella koreensis GR20-10]OQP49548.1 arylsulfatase [Niastella koreensis]
MATNKKKIQQTNDDKPADQQPFKTNLDRYHLPVPEWDFPNAKIGMYANESKPDFPPVKTAPKGSPNILLVLLDDVGFGWPSVTGGLVRTPTAEKLAKNGLLYNQFHTTALCSPSRASLLTGRNHHTVATGVIQEMATGYPGYCGIIPKSCATFAELLKQSGYSCAWFGKNHNVPDNYTSPAGPFDNWPTNQGFDYFYGFIAGETDQFYPSLLRNTEAIEPPRKPEEGYQLTRDLADECIGWVRRQKTIAPDRPFMAYFSTGAAHAPHQPPLDWRGKNTDRFNMGWDEYRKTVFQNQLNAGIIPKGSKLTERPKQIPSWDSQAADAKKLFSIQAENYADFLEHADYEVGRVVEAIEQLGELDNTLIIYIIGDNGSSGEGSLVGTPNEIMSLNGRQPSMEESIGFIDRWGMPGTSPHYAVGWAWAGDTPFQWTKQVASHFGGTRNPMIISWPAVIKDTGKVRSQFHHIIDVMPTLMEIIGIREPKEVNGYIQKPIEGTSFAYTFFEANATKPSTRTQQYFEMLGNRAMYADGWIACCRHGRLPWETSGSYSFDTDVWELYNIMEDFCQADDRATKEPNKLRELQDLFMAAAAKYNVLPLDDSFAERLDVTLRPGYFTGRKKVTFYPGLTRLPEGSGPKLIGIPFTVTAKVDIPKDGAEGVIFALGGDAAGWSLFLWEQKVRFHYNFFTIRRYDVQSQTPLSAGKHTITITFEPESPKPGCPADVTMAIDGKGSAKGHIDEQIPMRCGTETMDVGMDCVSPVCSDYEKKGLFPFTGTIESVTFEFGETKQPTGMERLELATKMD